MNALREFFDRRTLSRSRILLHGCLLLLINVLSIFVYGGMLSLFPLEAVPNSQEYRTYFIVLFGAFLLLTGLGAIASWFFATLLRPLSWYTPVAVVLGCFGAFVLLLDIGLAALAYGQIMVPGARLFGD